MDLFFTLDQLNEIKVSLPEFFIRGTHVRVGRNAAAYLGIAYVAQLIPVRACATLSFRCFPSRSVVRARGLDAKPPAAGKERESSGHSSRS